MAGFCYKRINKITFEKRNRQEGECGGQETVTL